MNDVVWPQLQGREFPDVGTELVGYNVQWEDGKAYGRWRRVLRKHGHGLR